MTTKHGRARHRHPHTTATHPWEVTPRPQREAVRQPRPLSPMDNELRIDLYVTRRCGYPGPLDEYEVKVTPRQLRRIRKHDKRQLHAEAIASRKQVQRLGRILDALRRKG